MRRIVTFACLCFLAVGGPLASASGGGHGQRGSGRDHGTGFRRRAANSFAPDRTSGEGGESNPRNVPPPNLAPRPKLAGRWLSACVQRHRPRAGHPARELLGIEPIEIPGGHLPMVEDPESLADLLDRLARDRPRLSPERSAGASVRAPRRGRRPFLDLTSGRFEFGAQWTGPRHSGALISTHSRSHQWTWAQTSRTPPGR